MHLELDKDDLVSLVKGTSPYYTAMDHPLIQRYGHHSGGHLDSWTWVTNSLRGCTEEQLLEIYKICKSSWK